MDILISSNLERMIYHAAGNDAELTARLMKDLAEKGRYELPKEVLEKLQSEFFGGYCDDEQTKATIKEIYDKYSYTCDTHTAVAASVYKEYRKNTGDETVSVIASTASPFKFNQSVLIALEDYNYVMGKDEFELLKLLRDKSGMKIPESLAELKDRTPIFDTVVAKEDMENIFELRFSFEQYVKDNVILKFSNK